MREILLFQNSGTALHSLMRTLCDAAKHHISTGLNTGNGL